jgi:hypothetical protein
MSTSGQFGELVPPEADGFGMKSGMILGMFLDNSHSPASIIRLRLAGLMAVLVPEYEVQNGVCFTIYYGLVVPAFQTSPSH